MTLKYVVMVNILNNFSLMCYYYAALVFGIFAKIYSTLNIAFYCLQYVCRRVIFLNSEILKFEFKNFRMAWLTVHIWGKGQDHTGPNLGILMMYCLFD